MKQEAYTAIFEQDEHGHWIVEIKEMPHCHTFAFTLTDAKRKIREALGLWIDNADSVHIEYEIVIAALERKKMKTKQFIQEITVSTLIIIAILCVIHFVSGCSQVIRPEAQCSQENYCFTCAENPACGWCATIQDHRGCYPRTNMVCPVGHIITREPRDCYSRSPEETRDEP